MGDDDELGDFNPGTTEDAPTETGDEEMSMASDSGAPGAPRPDRDENGYNTGRQDAVSSGAKVRGKVKRGTGTRDQDEIVVEGRGATGAEAVADFDAALRAIEELGTAERLRNINAERDDEDND